MRSMALIISLAVPFAVTLTAGDAAAIAQTAPSMGLALGFIDLSSLTASQIFDYYSPVYLPAAVLLIFLYSLYKLIRYTRYKDEVKEEGRSK